MRRPACKLCIHHFSGEAAEWCFSIRCVLVLRRNAKPESPPPLHILLLQFLFPYYSPSLDFQHHHARHYRCQKLYTEYELSGMRGCGRPCRGGARGEEQEEVEGDAQVSVLQFWPAVTRLRHFSPSRRAPIGALIKQAPVAPSGVKRRGPTPHSENLPLSPGLCLSRHTSNGESSQYEW